MPTWKAYAKKDDITATKLDDFAAPDDNTDLNATAAAHGLLPKLSNVVTEFLNGTGVFSVPAGGVGVKVKAETRAANAASGDVSYTGYGFQPSGLIIFAYLSTSYFSIGSSDPVKACTNFHLTATTTFAVDHTRIIYAGTGTNYQFAVVTTYDADGFTLTWTYGGTLAGTIYLFVFAFK